MNEDVSPERLWLLDGVLYERDAEGRPCPSLDGSADRLGPPLEGAGVEWFDQFKVSVLPSRQSP